MKTAFLQPLRYVALLALLWVVPQSHTSAQEFEVDGIWYSVLSEGGVKVIPNPDGSMYSHTEVVLPETVSYEGTEYTVTEIGSMAFNQCADLISVTIPKSVTTVASKAFYECSGLKYVKMADGSTPLSFTDNYQFWTSPLDSAYIGRNLEYRSGPIAGGNSPFVGRSSSNITPIKKVEFGDSVTIVNRRLFQYSASLESIVFGDNVTEILSNAFGACTALNSLVLPASVTTIDNAFSRCDNISRVVCLAQTPPSLSGFPSVKATLYVPEGCLEAYQNDDVWGNERYFAKIIDAPYVPDFMVDGIKYSLVGKGEVGVVAINDTTKYEGNIVLPETVTYEGVTYTLTTICRDAFNQCRELTSVQIPATVISIEESAFAYSGLASIELPEPLASIGENAFAYCTNLRSVALPDSLTALGVGAFERCTQLMKVTIPEGVRRLEVRTFSGCYVDTMIVKSMTPPTVMTSAIAGGNVLVVPTGSLAAYLNAKGWQDFYEIEEEGGYSNVFEVDGVRYKMDASAVTVIGGDSSDVIIPDSVMYGRKYAVTAIADQAFWGELDLRSVVISEGVVTLGSYAFENCVNLRSISIPSTLVNGNFSYQYNEYNRTYAPAFRGCSGLESIIVAEGHPNLDSRGGCNALIWTNEGWNGVELMMGCKNTVIPDGVTQIAPYAFAGTDVGEVIIPNSVTRIGTKAFQGCENLTVLHIGSGLTEFDYMGHGGELREQIGRSFSSSTSNNLEIIVVDEGNPLIDSRNGCNAIIETATNTLVFASNSTKIPEDVTEVTADAFYACHNLKSIYIPANLTTIPYGAFSMCTNLESIVVDEANPVYDSRNNCNAIIETNTDSLVRGCKTTVIPEDVVFIGHYAFSGCSGLEEIVIPDAVHSIGEGAFGYCSHLRTITLGSGVKSIVRCPFADMSFASRLTMPLLKTIVFKGSVPPAFFDTYGAFSELMQSYVHLLVPEGALAAYQSAEVWKDFAHITESEGAVEFEYDGICYRIIIGNDSAMVRPRLDKESTTMVSVYPDSIVIPETVWYDGKEYVVNAIGEYAFYDCELNYLSIPATVKEIGYDGLSAFFNGPVTCYATIPPRFLRSSSFGVSNDAVLRVPKASMELYEQALWWEKFWLFNAKVEAIEDATGIEHIETGMPYLQTNAVYDLSGHRITDVENLESGIYIVNGKKVVIK